MNQTPQKTTLTIDEYKKNAHELTDQSQAVKLKQIELIDSIKSGGISHEKATELCEEYQSQQQELVDKLAALYTPEEISGPAAILKSSLEERVEAAKKTLEYIKTGDEQIYNNVKEHMIRSTGGVNSAFIRMKDVQ